MVSLTIAIVAVALHLGVSFYRSTPLSRHSKSRHGKSRYWHRKVVQHIQRLRLYLRDSGDDIFVHFRAIRGEGHRVLVEGQRVEFSVMNRDKGLQAEDVIAALPRR